MYTIMSSANSENLTYFLIWITFISFSSLISVAVIENFTIKNNVCCNVSLYYVEVGSFYAHFLKCFNHKWVLNFVKGFVCIYWDNMLFIFQFVNVVYHIDWFIYIEESLHSWSKPNLIMVYELFDVLLNSVC